MKPKPKDKNSPQGPTIATVVVAAVLSAVLGVVVAAFCLAAAKVAVVDKLPDEQVKGQTYFVQGRRASDHSQQWVRKQQLLIDGTKGVISLSEAELNAWSAETYGKAEAPAGASYSFTPQSPNFRIEEGVLQIGIQGKADLFGLKRDVVIQARGGFVNSGGRYVFKSDELKVGALPAHLIPGLAEAIEKKLIAAFQVQEELQKSWPLLSQAKVEGEALVLELP